MSRVIKRSTYFASRSERTLCLTEELAGNSRAKGRNMFDRRDTMSASVNFIGSMPWSGNPPLNTDDVPTPLVWPAAEPFAKESVCAARPAIAAAASGPAL